MTNTEVLRGLFFIHPYLTPMTTTAPQVLTQLIDRVEEMATQLKGTEDHDILRDFMADLSTATPFKKVYGPLDDWEIDMATIMLALACVNGLAKTKKVDDNFKALDIGTHFLSQTVINLSDEDIELAIKVNESTNSLAQLYLLGCQLTVEENQDKKAAKALNRFISEGSPERMKALMDEAGRGFAS